MADRPSAEVLLVTSSTWPEGEPGGSLLVPALAARGIRARWVVWDDPRVDWSAADLVAVRSTWDYTERHGEFLSWARTVPRLMNGSEVFAWNTDKRYLVDLVEAGLPVVPTWAATDPSELHAAVEQVLADEAGVVVKPAVGAGGDGVRVLGSVAEADELLVDRPVVVQPLVESVHAVGELSVFVLEGEAGAAVQKRPAAGEIRVHEEFGGRTERIEPSAEMVRLAERVVAETQCLLGATLDYARVDLMQGDDGRLLVGELEVTEPGLYLDVLPENAEKFAELLRRVLDR